MNLRGTLSAVCISSQKGVSKQPIDRAELVADFGIEGDAHGGAGHRQVSLLCAADMQSMRQRDPDIPLGTFGENLVITGLDCSLVGIGSVLQIGDSRLEVTQIGKVCHTRCDVYQSTGDCAMGRSGLFARVIRGGSIAPGMSVEVITLIPRQAIQAAVLTVSDRCSRGEAEDTAGPAVMRLLSGKLEAHMAAVSLVPDEIARISSSLKDWAERGLDLLITVGGTGCAPRDVTPEATRQIIEKEVPGLAEAMRRESAKITPHALSQRGVCGICRSSLIINLPGSEKAAVENLTVILPSLPHIIQLLRGESVH